MERYINKTEERQNVYREIIIGDDKISKARKDYTGQKFGDLTVVDMIYNYNKEGQSICVCKCVCGNICRKVPAFLRRAKNPPHCGCKTEYYKKPQSERNHKDLTGQKFGRLTVKSMTFKFREHTMANCICDCGNEISVPATYLTCGDTTSCGCYHRERTSQSNTKDYTGIANEYGVKLLKQYHKNKHGTWLWECECGCCGGTFIALPAKVLEGRVSSCGCAKSSSKERLISNILDNIGIVYKREHIFQDCRNVYPLRYDFYLPDFNSVIEYQGQQHYKNIDYFGGQEGFKCRQTNDKIKREYCADKNISLLELPYSLSSDEIKKEIYTFCFPRDCLA